MKTKLFAALLFLGAFGFYLKNVAPSVTAGDSGEFITAAATLALPHAPSFPLYTLTAGSFVRAVPWGNIGYRCNVFSALISAGALSVIFLIGVVAIGNFGVSALLAASIGLTASFWENSLVTEVFSLNALFMAGLLLCLVKAKENRCFYALYAFLLGLGLGNHHIIVLTLPAFFIAVWFDSSRVAIVKQIGTLLIVGALGLSVYLFLPVRSVKQPPLNWGQPTTVSKLMRTLTRKDYGSFTLALGSAPERNTANTRQHLSNFARHMVQETPWPLLLLALVGFVMGFKRKDPFAFMMFAVFLFSGPFFLLLGNLPFNSQSDGIIGRFYVMPVLAFVLGGVGLFKDRKWVVSLVLFVGCLFGLRQNWAEAASYRQSMVVLDYGRAMLRTLPPNAALYMDGGDDAFYSLAMLHHGMGRRPDVVLHDRGGLVFKNPYGDDFRSLTKDQKKARREKVERAVLAERELFYSSMDMKILPGVRIRQVGFLLEAVKNSNTRIDWPIVILRSLRPVAPNNYRTRSLAAFFPYMRGKSLLSQKQEAEALRYFDQAGVMGSDVDWLKSNLGAEYAQLGYVHLVANEFSAAEKVYQQWIRFDPDSDQAQGNLGVVYEKQGRLEDARAQYKRAAERFPKSADPVFNLAVLAWKDAKWSDVVNYLEEVLRRRPDHLQAQGYLRVARERAAKESGR